jgi:hypothetical protein
MYTFHAILAYIMKLILKLIIDNEIFPENFVIFYGKIRQAQEKKLNHLEEKNLKFDE